LAVFAVAIGAILGYLAQSGLAWLLRGLIRSELPAASLAPLPIALVTVLAMLIGFALPPLLQLKSTPPARVLRKTVSAPPLRYGLSYLLALGALFAILWSLVRDAELVFSVLAGVLGVGLVLTVAGYALVRLTSRLRGGVGVAWRYGLANVSRRGGDSVVQIVAFGLGLMVLLLLAVVRGDLLADWRRSLPANVPNNFLINIRPEERQALLDFLQSRGLGQPQLYPMVRARITAINARPAETLKFPDDRGRGFLEREQNLTWSAGRMEDNQLIAGTWWKPADAGRPLVSISTEYQENLQLKLGDKISFDVAGETVTAEVASIRKIRWDSFRPNFFLVFPPGLLDGAAGTYMTSVYLTPSQRPSLADLVRQFPTISVFDVDAILKQIREIMDRASLAVQYVFLFTLAAGIVVLLAAVQSTRDERRYESAMLRTGRQPRHGAAGRRRRILGAGISLGHPGCLRRNGGGLGIGAALVLARIHPRPLGVGPGVGVRHDSGRGERHFGHAPSGQHAPHSHIARRVSAVQCTSSSSQPTGMGMPRGGSASMRTV
jgi:putative ABC transport system permease protein